MTFPSLTLARPFGPDWIRTNGHQFRKLLLCPSELRGHGRRHLDSNQGVTVLRTVALATWLCRLNKKGGVQWGGWFGIPPVRSTKSDYGD